MLLWKVFSQCWGGQNKKGSTKCWNTGNIWQLPSMNNDKICRPLLGLGLGVHCRATSHSESMENTKVLTGESNWHQRKVKEATYVKQRAPAVNRDQVNHLFAIYNQITRYSAKIWANTCDTKRTETWCPTSLVLWWGLAAITEYADKSRMLYVERGTSTSKNRQHFYILLFWRPWEAITIDLSTRHFSRNIENTLTYVHI